AQVRAERLRQSRAVDRRYFGRVVNAGADHRQWLRGRSLEPVRRVTLETVEGRAHDLLERLRKPRAIRRGLDVPDTERRLTATEAPRERRPGEPQVDAVLREVA